MILGNFIVCHLSRVYRDISNHCLLRRFFVTLMQPSWKQRTSGDRLGLPTFLSNWFGAPASGSVRQLLWSERGQWVDCEAGIQGPRKKRFRIEMCGLPWP